MSFEDNLSLSNAENQELQVPDEDTKTEEVSENFVDTKINCDTETKGEDLEVSKGREGGSKFDSEIDFDQKLYEEVLEKLDIRSKDVKDANDANDANDNNQGSQEKLIQEKSNDNLQKIQQTENQLKAVIAQDFSKIQKLMQSGLINSVQGQNLKKQVLKKAFDVLVQTEKIKRNAPELLQQAPKSQAVSNANVFEEFSKENPDFFVPEGRKEVLDYLKSGDVILGKDELNKISTMIRSVEKTAIDRYLKKVAYEKNLRNANENAKLRLTANAQKTSFSGSYPKSFTREQIGKMSSAEFTKYESLIMEQLKKGLIR